MLKYYFILFVTLFSINLMAQVGCVELNDYDSSQVWIQKILKLDKDEQKDSVLQRIKCERIIGEKNLKFSLTCIFDGLIALKIPESRDNILKKIDSENMQLISSLCETEGIYPEKCNLGFLLVSGFEKPIIDNISTLTIKKIDRKKGTIRVVVNSHETSDFDFRIEDFSNADNSKTEIKHLKRGKNQIKYSVDKELKVITITDNDNKVLIIK